MSRHNAIRLEKIKEILEAKFVNLPENDKRLIDEFIADEVREIAWKRAERQASRTDVILWEHHNQRIYQETLDEYKNVFYTRELEKLLTEAFDIMYW